MLNKNDPLIGAVQEVMRKNQAERDAVKAVNEKFGVVDRRALPHEQQANWDAAYAKVLTEGVEALDEVLDTPGKKLGYAVKHNVSHMKAKLTGDDKTSAKRERGAKLFGKKMEKDKEKREMDSHRNELARGVLRDMGRKTGYGSTYDKMFKEEELSPKQKMLAKLGGNKKKIDAPDLAAARAGKASHIEEENLEEKAVSKAQHRFFGLVRGIQKGKAKGSPEAMKAAKSMSAKSVRDYAKTKEAGLPEKVKKD